MTADRELLALAAKVAGIDIGWYEMIAFVVTDNGPESWNPLTDDGDALRLAVKLGLTVQIERDD
ncbi:hypothetical protein BjapCC829_28635 [Bradyrhizobium barranii]|uniref:Uncharacterized protein n=1 Tax=Bradyrhizobium barranii TaxID=2992140 RepID=A0ABY3QD82_9BRAD|nr:hypothetical protein [Bradyrhizobium japonicum]UFW83909.1 hypothetical protein BjapCC829_28635 [Bradyrhizobium japonicum]